MTAPVLVGLSGGVDSSVAAAMLARAGREVIGVSLQLYDHSQGGRAARCCSPEDFLDARRVAAQVGFPYYVINEEETFGRRILDDFVGEYRGGRTPNPCVRCNSEVKFAGLLRLARALGAGAVATGHYARVQVAPEGGRRLLRARDLEKDQSYFLFDLTPEQLDAALFPLGEMTKDQVRAEAVRLGLATAGKPESQDVCFLEGGDYRAFVRRHAGGRPGVEPDGDVVDAGGRVLGRHDGLSGFTVGQRRRLGVSAGRRLYVVRLDVPANRVVLGEADDLACRGIELSGVRLAAGRGTAGAAAAFRASVKIRYRHEGAPALVLPAAGGRAAVVFDAPLRGAAPGQAAVFYDGDTVLGGGWIETAQPAARDAPEPDAAASDAESGRRASGAPA